ncbi:MAG: type III secretion system export apparatus subunit SctU [Rhabdochlamydiaceae bacterium]
MAEKTEKATPKKLRDARKKGQVAKSQDFPSAFTFVVSIATVIISSGYLFQVLASYIITMFKLSSTNVDLQNRAGGIFSEAIQVIFNTSMPIMVLTACVGLLTNFLIVGPMFSVEAMKPDIKRLNPVTNIKNLFKLKTLFELLKSIFKISGALILIYTVVWYSIPEIVSTAALPVIGSAMVFSDFLIKVIIRVGIFFLIIAIFDLVFQKKNFAKEMKMEKFEVKQEFKDTEGDPQIKSKRRQTAQEIAYQEGPMSVKRAKAVITNPIHIAVAVEYNAETEPAPRIVTMGKGTVADLIMKIAQENGIPIMRNVTLAQTLFEKGKISEYIPEDTYKAVAEILRWLEGIETLETTGLELFK